MIIQQQAQQPESIKQHCLNIISAVPGSGKTTTILDSIGTAICKWKVSASRILVITFSKDMAVELDQKLSDRGVGGVNTLTFHAFARRLIESDPQHFGLHLERAGIPFLVFSVAGNISFYCYRQPLIFQNSLLPLLTQSDN